MITSRRFWAGFAVIAAASLFSFAAFGQAPVAGPAEPMSYYSAPNSALVAQMYPSPRPTPPQVGRTDITYQPFYPNENLYQHHRTYVTQTQSGLNHTNATWGHNNFPDKMRNFFIGHNTKLFHLGLSERNLRFGPN